MDLQVQLVNKSSGQPQLNLPKSKNRAQVNPSLVEISAISETGMQTVSTESHLQSYSFLSRVLPSIVMQEKAG